MERQAVIDLEELKRWCELGFGREEAKKWSEVFDDPYKAKSGGGLQGLWIHLKGFTPFIKGGVLVYNMNMNLFLKVKTPFTKWGILAYNIYMNTIYKGGPFGL